MPPAPPAAPRAPAASDRSELENPSTASPSGAPRPSSPLSTASRVAHGENSHFSRAQSAPRTNLHPSSPFLLDNPAQRDEQRLCSARVADLLTHTLAQLRVTPRASLSALLASFPRPLSADERVVRRALQQSLGFDTRLSVDAAGLVARLDPDAALGSAPRTDLLLPREFLLDRMLRREAMEGSSPAPDRAISDFSVEQATALVWYKFHTCELPPVATLTEIEAVLEGTTLQVYNLRAVLASDPRFVPAHTRRGEAFRLSAYGSAVAPRPE